MKILAKILAAILKKLGELFKRAPKKTVPRSNPKPKTEPAKKAEKKFPEKKPCSTQNCQESKPKLNKKQEENLKRFEEKLPKDAGPTTVKDLPDGGKVFQAEVPAANIPGSKAVYEKTVDAAGNTVKYIKTTYAPDGTIVHIKQKFP